MADLPYIKPDGTKVWIPETSRAQAEAQGYKPEDPARAAAGEQPLRAGLEAAARGATFGLSDKLAIALESGLSGTERPQAAAAVKARKEENPVASTVGEIAGGIGMTLATGGGPSALVGHGVRGAVLEGGLYGLGSTISEANLEDRELKAENMAAGLAGGALTGGALAGTFKALGKGVSMGTKALGGSTLGDVLTKAGRDVEWRSYAQTNTKFIKKYGQYKDEIVDLGRKLGVNALDADSLQKVEAHIGEGSQLGDEYSALLDKMESNGKFKLSDPAVKSKIIDRVKAGLKTEYGNLATYDSAVESTEKLVEAQLFKPNVKWRDLKEFQTSLFDKLPKNNSAPGVDKEVLETARDLVLRTIDDVAENTNPGMGAQFRRIQKDYATGYALKDMLENRVKQLEASGGPFDVLGARSMWAGLGTGAMTGNPLMGLGAAFATRQMDRRGGLIAGRVLESLGSGTALKSATQLQQRISTVLAANPAILGKFAIPLMNAGARGAEDLLAEHASIASGPDGDAYLAALGMSRETPEEVKAAGERLAVYDAIDAHAKENAEVMRRAVDGFFGSRPGPAPAVPSMDRKDFDARLQAIKSVLVNHQGVFEAIPPEFLGMAPETAGLTGQKLLGAAQFLLDKAPRSPWEDKPVALQQPWKPSDADTARWYRYVETVEEPMKAVERLREGSASPEHVEALKAVYPQTFAQLQQAMAEKLMLWKEPLPWDKRQTLAQVLGPQVFATPQQVSILQQVHAKNRQGQQGAGGGGSKPDGRQEVNATKNQATQAQKLEAR